MGACWDFASDDTREPTMINVQRKPCTVCSTGGNSVHPQMCEHARGADTVRDGRFSHAILGAPPCSEMKPHATRLIAGSLQQRLLGVAGGLTCGRKRWQKVLWFPRKGARRCVYFFDLYLEYIWSGFTRPHMIAQKYPARTCRGFVEVLRQPKAQVALTRRCQSNAPELAMCV